MDTPSSENALPSPQFIRLDLFPASITNADAPELHQPPVREMRVIVTDEHLVIFVDAPSGPPVPGYISPLLDFEGNNKVGWVVTTEDGTFKINRSSGCGCGSRLRGIHPFPQAPFRAERE